MGVISNSVRSVIDKMRAIASTSSVKRTKTELTTNRYSSWIDDASFIGPGMEWRWSLDEWIKYRRSASLTVEWRWISVHSILNMNTLESLI